MTELPRSPELLSQQDSRLLIVDMQERFAPVIDNWDGVLANCVRLVRAAQILEMPVSATEQYPKGLGPTVAELAELLGEIPDKLAFSCLNAVDWAGSANEPESRFRIVVAGIEAHVCIQQTVFDLLAHGFRIYLPCDALSSRRSLDREIAFERMQSAGAVLTTTESILFEWCQQAGTPQFKEVSRLVDK